MFDFFRVNLPYGIARNDNDEWMAFNREYRPLGFNPDSKKKDVNEGYLDFPVYTKFKRLTEKFLVDLVGESKVQRNEKGEVITVFLYDDGTNPMNREKDHPELWDDYFKKLKKLSKLKVDRRSHTL